MNSEKFLACLWLSVLLVSCIQDEAPNAEADIESCTAREDVLLATPQIENNRIQLLVKAGADLTAITLDFTLTPGAVIEPPGGTAKDFTTPQTYVVTSEDKKWKKTYTISCNTERMKTDYGFEHFELDSEKQKYYVFYELTENNVKQENWASGNDGFSITAGNSSPEEYPTVPHENGRTGYCLKLVTKSTGSLGALVKKPIAAGNLFIGTFDGTYALTNPLGVTHFGVPFDAIPTSLAGYYQYGKGETVTDKNNQPVADKEDSFDIYGVLYETDEDTEYLDGSNSLTHPNIISLARIGEEEKKETGEWTRFELPFVYMPGKSIDPDKLAAKRYNLAIVFTSSIEGAYFTGAVGSTLLIDDVTLDILPIGDN